MTILGAVLGIVGMWSLIEAIVGFRLDGLGGLVVLFVGVVLFFIGGRRDAARKIKEWEEFEQAQRPQHDTGPKFPGSGSDRPN